MSVDAFGQASAESNGDPVAILDGVLCLLNLAWCGSWEGSQGIALVGEMEALDLRVQSWHAHRLGWARILVEAKISVYASPLFARGRHRMTRGNCPWLHSSELKCIHQHGQLIQKCTESRFQSL